jgi:hypothetical protein
MRLEARQTKLQPLVQARPARPPMPTYCPGVVPRRHLRKVPIGETAVRLERFRDPSLQHRRLRGTSPLLTAERLR